jgi:two-component system LytT family response regulator
MPPHDPEPGPLGAEVPTGARPAPPLLVADPLAARLTRTAALLRDDLGLGLTGVRTARVPSRVATLVRETGARIVLLHAELLGGGSFDVLEALTAENRCAVILTGATPGDAVRAFALGAIDCFPDPMEAPRLRLALERAREHLELLHLASLRTVLRDALTRSLRATAAADGTARARPDRPDANPFQSRFAVRLNGRVLIIPASDVEWISAAGNYVRLRVGTRWYTLRECMSRLEERLDPAHFARIHRAVIVNLDRVVSTRPIRGGDAAVTMESGEELRLSRSYRARFRSQLKTAG